MAVRVVERNRMIWSRRDKRPKVSLHENWKRKERGELGEGRWNTTTFERKLDPGSSRLLGKGDADISDAEAKQLESWWKERARERGGFHVEGSGGLVPLSTPILTRKLNQKERNEQPTPKGRRRGWWRSWLGDRATSNDDGYHGGGILAGVKMAL